MDLGRIVGYFECECGGHNFTRIFSLKRDDLSGEIVMEDKYIRCQKCGREHKAEEVNKFFGVK